MQVIRRYPITLPVYQVVDVDTNEVLAERIDMTQVVRRYGEEITNVLVYRQHGEHKEY